jgi:arylsulfatase A-like enzyme
MDVFLNGDQLGSTISNLPVEWGELRINLPADRLVEGENKVRFHFARSETTDQGRTAGGFDWARIQAVSINPYSEHQDGYFGVLNRDTEHPILVSPIYGGFAAYVTPPAGSRLRLFVNSEGVDPEHSQNVRIVISTDGAEPVVVWEGTISADGLTPVDIELDPWADEVIRIDLRGTGGVAAGAIHWTAPTIWTRTGESRTIAEEARPQRILIWLIDTLRPDHYPVYNPDSRVQTPNISEFSNRCATFLRASVQGNSSLPSSASIHSATYPTVHRLNSGDRRIPRDLTLIAEPFDAAGWATALHSSNGYVAERRRFVEGYDDYRNLIQEHGRAHTERLWPLSLEWLDSVREERWFDFLNTIDPHVPYDPPEEILSVYHPEPYTGRIRPRSTGELLDGLGNRGLSDPDLRYLLALYDGEITYNDVWFGTALEDLQSRDWLDSTLIVITSDHGEQFFEHGRGGHGSGVWEEVMHVPLMLCHVGSLGSGQLIDEEVELVDLFPTLLDVVGLDLPASVQGTSLLPLILDETVGMNRPGFSYHQDDIRGMRIGRWKYILRGGDLEALYDLNESRFEGEDRQDEFPIAHRYMRDVLSFHLAYDTEWRKSEWGFANNHSSVLAEILDRRTW